MPLDNLALFVTIVIGSFAVSNAMAGSKNPDNTTRTASTQRAVIDGSLEPEKIPDSVKYSFLLSGYELRVRSALANRLSFEDEEVLRKLAARNRIDQEPINESYEQARLHLCANRQAMSPVELAHEWTRIVDDWRAKTEARYRQGLDALSKQGRQVVEEYVAGEIVPGIKTSAPVDGIQAASDDPNAFLEAVEVECYYAVNGQLPEDMQERFEELFRGMDEEGQNDTE